MLMSPHFKKKFKPVGYNRLIFSDLVKSLWAVKTDCSSLLLPFQRL
jgi:hypothetical protein